MPEPPIASMNSKKKRMGLVGVLSLCSLLLSISFQVWWYLIVDTTFPYLAGINEEEFNLGLQLGRAWSLLSAITFIFHITQRRKKS